MELEEAVEQSAFVAVGWRISALDGGCIPGHELTLESAGEVNQWPLRSDQW
jgi:hypothetical protein